MPQAGFRGEKSGPPGRWSGELGRSAATPQLKSSNPFHAPLPHQPGSSPAFAWHILNSEPQRPPRGCEAHAFTPAWTSPLSPDCLSQSRSHPRHFHPGVTICRPPPHPSPPGRKASPHPLLPCLTTLGEGPVLSVPSPPSTPCPGSGTCLSPGCHNDRPTGVPAWIRLPQTSSQPLRSNMWLAPGSSQ